MPSSELKFSLHLLLIVLLHFKKRSIKSPYTACLHKHCNMGKTGKEPGSLCLKEFCYLQKGFLIRELKIRSHALVYQNLDLQMLWSGHGLVTPIIPGYQTVTYCNNTYCYNT